jgi:hypothetical protein
MYIEFLKLLIEINYKVFFNYILFKQSFNILKLEVKLIKYKTFSFLKIKH